MEDKGQMNEVIEQMKLMNVLLSKHDKREETKENNATFRRCRGCDEIVENDFAYFIVENYEQSCRNVKEVLKRRE
ncbi:unnamed protein product [Bathycoccus prasinos]